MQKSSTESLKVRLTVKQDFYKNPPSIIDILWNHYQTRCRELGLCFASCSVDVLPKSVNHQYIHTRFNTRLDPDVYAFRLLVHQAMLREKWKPTGLTASILIFESPLWLTKKNTVREMDVDNRVKPTLDAIEKCTATPDELHFQLHVFKIPSKRTRTTVYLFDTGDVTEYYS